MTGARLPFIDTMKAAGMFLIVAGHVVGGQVNFLTPPIYYKQWGVAFFLFVTAYTLARETRPVAKVVVNRLFELLLVGLVAAVVSTIVSLALGGRGQLSNFKPLLFGINVFYDHFPANPTTWFIGTYIHLIVLWAVAGRRLRPTPLWILSSAVVEILVRVAFWQSAGAFVAYMAVPNWMTVWLLGAYCGQRPVEQSRALWLNVAAAVAVALPLAAGTLWVFDESFPFRVVSDAGAFARLATSAGVTLIYVGATWLAYQVALRLPANRWVEFAARQTVVIFVVHMPVYYWLLPMVDDWSRPVRGVFLLATCFVGLALAGGALRRLVDVAALRQYVVAIVSPRLARRGV